MAETGWTLPTSAANYNTGAAAWSNPTNALASDNSRASCAVVAISSGDSLGLSGFGFAIPAGSTINSISVRVEGYESPGGRSIRVRLFSDATTQTTEWSEVLPELETSETSVDSVFTFSPAPPAVADINAANFGVTIVGSSTSGTYTYYVDAVWLNIDYTPPTGSRSTFIGV